MKKTVKIITYGGFRKNIEYFCTCGYHVITKVSGEFCCPTCGNEDILFLDRKYKTKVFDNGIYVIDKGLKHFHVAKDKYRIVFHKDNTITIKMASKQEFKYDLRQKEKVIINTIINTNGEKVEEYRADERRINAFFDNKIYISLISTEENKTLFEFAYNRLSRLDWEERTCTMGKSLVRLMKHPYLELLYYGGFNRYEHLRRVVNDSNWYNTNATNLLDFFQVRKQVLVVMRKMDDISKYAMEGLTNLYNSLGGHNFKTVIGILEQETELYNFNIANFSYLFLELYDKYSYKNVEKLTTYVSREVKLQQGIDNPNDGLMYLKDYIRMMKELGYEPEKYPKSLKKVHDIANMNYKINADKILERQFGEQVISDDYKGLAFKSKEYSIIAPSESNDLIKEGESLSHCVASYVKDVAKGLCKILFLRETRNVETPVVTIEIRGNQIKQIRGKGNRIPTNPEKEFVEKWAEKKNLTLQYY
ncbi:putative PcfJ-like protein [Brevibacillus phage Sundance]|uniref:putative PcfJ-like protein n=1 Tax=Brevibacillus phage Sundance TaxID=1691958 RepID=UPI0006BDD655|nr:putative PcfJ-like protein [Brevibacillus phage Sundance]ALA47954.1 putative PcfJ-like protein [Brevibacillus phage Sundance]